MMILYVDFLLAEANVTVSQILLILAALLTLAAPLLVAIGRNIISTRQDLNRRIDEATPEDELHEAEKRKTTPGWIALLLGVASLLLAVTCWSLFATGAQIGLGGLLAENEIADEDLDRMEEEGNFNDFDWDEGEEVDIRERFGNNPDLDQAWGDEPDVVADPPLDDDNNAFEQNGDQGNNLVGPGNDIGNRGRAQPRRFNDDRRINRPPQARPRNPAARNPQPRQPANQRNRPQPKFNNPVGRPANPAPNRRPPAPGRNVVRKWTSKEGDFQFTGRFQGVRGGTVILRSDAGVVINYPMNKLSRDDQNWISENGSVNNSGVRQINRGRPETSAGVERLENNANRNRDPRNNRTRQPANRPAASTRPNPRGMRGNADPANPTRVWTSSDGRQRIRATFRKRLGTRVYLTRPENQEKFSLPYSKFSDDDKEWIKTYGKEKSNTVNTIQLTITPPPSPPKIGREAFSSVAASAGDLLLSGGPNCPTLVAGPTIWSWNAAANQFEEMGSLPQNEGAIIPKTISPDGKQIAGFVQTENRDWQLTIWNRDGSRKGTLKEDWQGSPDENTQVRFAHNYLFVGQPDGDSISVWNTETKQVDGAVLVEQRIASQVFDVTQDGNFFVFPKDRGISILDTTSGEIVANLPLPEELPIAHRVRNKSLRLLEPTGETEPVRLSKDLKHISFSPDGEQVVAILQNNAVRSLFIWDREGQLLHETQYLPGKLTLNRVSWLGDQGFLIDDNIVERKTGLVVAQINAPTDSIVAIGPETLGVAPTSGAKLAVREIPWKAIQLSISSARVFHKMTLGPPTKLGLLLDIPGLTSEQAEQIESLLRKKFAANGMSISSEPQIFLDFRVSEAGENLTRLPTPKISIQTNRLIAEINHNGETIYRTDLGPSAQLNKENFEKLLSILRREQFPFYLSDSGLLALPTVIQ